MTKGETLKLALEFIERVNRDGWILADFEPEMYATITAIKETLAQPEREWVGLTDEERDHFEGLHLYAGRNQVEAWIEGVPSFINAIEAKLKDKNT